MSTLRATDQIADKLLDFIAKFESNGNYNAVIGNANAREDLSQLTLPQIRTLQRKLLAQGNPSTAIGRYQIIETTLLNLQTQLSTDPSQRFTTYYQDQLALQLLRQRGYTLWLNRSITSTEFAHRLSLEWASLPDPKNGGRSHYDGTAGNHAAIPLYRMTQFLEGVR